jgi:hypothetical protein
VREAEQLRREQKMEELKKRIADAARKAGLEETGSEEKLLRVSGRVRVAVASRSGHDRDCLLSRISCRFT